MNCIINLIALPISKINPPVMEKPKQMEDNQIQRDKLYQVFSKDTRWIKIFSQKDFKKEVSKMISTYGKKLNIVKLLIFPELIYS